MKKISKGKSLNGSERESLLKHGVGVLNPSGSLSGTMDILSSNNPRYKQYIDKAIELKNKAKQG